MAHLELARFVRGSHPSTCIQQNASAGTAVHDFQTSPDHTQRLHYNTPICSGPLGNRMLLSHTGFTQHPSYTMINTLILTGLSSAALQHLPFFCRCKAPLSKDLPCSPQISVALVAKSLCRCLLSRCGLPPLCCFGAAAAAAAAGRRFARGQVAGGPGSPASVRRLTLQGLGFRI